MSNQCRVRVCASACELSQSSYPPIAMLCLKDLNVDALIHIAELVPPQDWCCLAMVCRPTRDACRRAYVARYRSRHGKDPLKIRWRTQASTNDERLEWAVKHMGYRPNERTLCAVAFRGDLEFYKKVRRLWGLHSTDVYRFAGASGHIPMIREMIQGIATTHQFRNGAHRAIALSDVFVGMVAYDRVDALVAVYRYESHQRYTLELAEQCICDGSEAAFPFMLDHVPAASLTADAKMRMAVLAAGYGRAPILRVLFDRFGADLATHDAQTALMSRLFPDKANNAEQSWRHLWNPDDFRPVDHLQVFRYLVDDLQIDVPRQVISAAIRHGNLEAIDLLHRSHHPISTWDSEHWSLAFTFPTDLALADFVLRLDSTVRPDTEVLTLVTSRLTWVLFPGTQEVCVDALTLLRDRDVPWNDVCVRVAASRGALTVLQWMYRHGAPLDSETVLESAVALLEDHRGIARAVSDVPDRFFAMCTFLLSECRATWSASCLRLASEWTDDEGVLRWMVHAGAPVDQLSPRFARKLTLRGDAV